MKPNDWQRDGLYGKMHGPSPLEQKKQICEEIIQNARNAIERAKDQQEGPDYQEFVQKIIKDVPPSSYVTLDSMSGLIETKEGQDESKESDLDPTQPKALMATQIRRQDTNEIIGTYLTGNLDEIIAHENFAPSNGQADLDRWNKMGAGTITGHVGLPNPHQAVKIYRTILKDRRSQWNPDNIELHPQYKTFLDILAHLNPTANIKVEDNYGLLIRDLDCGLALDEHGDVCASGDYTDTLDQQRSLTFLYAYLLVFDDLAGLIENLHDSFDVNASAESITMTFNKFHMLVGVVKECVKIRRLQREGVPASELVRRFALYPVSEESWNLIHRQAEEIGNE